MKRTYLVLVALSLVAVACGNAEPTATTAGPSPTTTAAPTVATTEAPITTTSSTTEAPVDGESTGPAPTADMIVLGQPIVLSPTHYVVNVEADDVLNGRYRPGVGNAINAELDPGYGTVRAKGTTAELDDGSVWENVAYSADTQLVDEPDAYGYGWVNSHFIAPIEGWVPAGGACDLDGSADESFGDASSTANEVYDVIAVDLGDCIRIVVTFAESIGGSHLGVILPQLDAEEITRSRLRVDLPVDFVVPHTTDIFGDGVGALVAVNSSGGFWFDVAQPGRASVRSIEDQGQVIIDIEKGAVGAIFHHDRTIVALPPGGSADSFEFFGYARPFEATLGVIVGEHLGDSEYPESVHGDSVIVEGHALMTNGWFDAWGIYEFTVDDLASGVYDVIVADDGAVESDFPVVRFEVTVP